MGADGRASTSAGVFPNDWSTRGVSVPERIVFRCIVGSQAYGLATPESDTDRLEVYQAPRSAFLGLKSPPEHKVTKDERGDFTRWELGKFCRLALRGNPTALELLWTPLRLVEELSPTGSSLRGLRIAFLSKHLYFRYRGFVESQRQRMVQDGRSAHGHNIPAGEPYDYKAACHALRLCVQGAVLLGEWELPVDLRVPELSSEYRIIRRVRQGELTLGAFLSHLDDFRSRLDAAFADTTLPDEPDRARVESWLIATREAGDAA